MLCGDTASAATPPSVPNEPKPARPSVTFAFTAAAPAPASASVATSADLAPRASSPEPSGIGSIDEKSASSLRALRKGFAKATGVHGVFSGKDKGQDGQLEELSIAELEMMSPETMSVKQLKMAVHAAGLSSASCVEKADFLQLLSSYRRKTQEAATRGGTKTTQRHTQKTAANMTGRAPGMRRS